MIDFDKILTAILSSFRHIAPSPQRPLLAQTVHASCAKPTANSFKQSPLHLAFARAGSSCLVQRLWKTQSIWPNWAACLCMTKKVIWCVCLGVQLGDAGNYREAIFCTIHYSTASSKGASHFDTRERLCEHSIMLCKWCVTLEGRCAKKRT